MDIGELYAGLNALDAAMVARSPAGAFIGLKEGDQALNIPTTTGGLNNLTKLTQAQYDAIVTKDPAVLYVIVG